MPLEQDLRTQLTDALKARDLPRANVIRMLATKITERRTAADFKGEVDDALVLEVIAAYKKSLDKARVEFVAVGERGAAHVTELDQEIAFCQGFLPQQMDRAAVTEAVRAVISETGVTDVKMAGRVVGAVMKRHRGEADAALVKDVAEALLRGG